MQDVPGPANELQNDLARLKASIRAAGDLHYEAMSQADSALQNAREIGSDSFAPYCQSESKQRDRQRRIQTAELVMRAVRDGRLCVAFQPVVGNAAGEAVFYECLLRIRKEDGDIVAAAHFMPVVEQYGMAGTIDCLALDMAVAELKACPDISLAINVSSITATDRSWRRRLSALVRNRTDIASRLMVEITETFAMHDVEEMGRFVAAVRNLGCRVALDDFGAGYTSFRHLKALTIDVVKIDGSFIRNIATTFDDRIFVRTLLDLAGSLGFRTVAECVESKPVVDLLWGEGVSYLQGYYYGEPSIERPWLAKGISAVDGRVQEAIPLRLCVATPWIGYQPLPLRPNASS